MAASDLSVLLDMGFEEERAQMAVKQTGGCKLCCYLHSKRYVILTHLLVQGALQWLEDQQSKQKIMKMIQMNYHLIFWKAKWQSHWSVMSVERSSGVMHKQSSMPQRR